VLGAPALPARVLVGPRQCGKSALLAHLLPNAIWLSLDDLGLRLRAQNDPALLFEAAGSATDAPVVLDEAAYAPNLFPEIKRRIDRARRKGEPEPALWLTGSNRLLLDKSVRESLAGRASYFFLHTLSVAEIGDRGTLSDWLFRGGWPELYVRRELDPARYLDDYVRTFVEKDVAATAGVERVHEFQRALQLLAARTGTLLNASDIGRLAGVQGQTIAAWIELLERNALVLLLRPFHANLSKRVVRSPKLYFLDAGLAAHLQGWRAPAPMLTSPQAGLLFETLVLGELVRARDHRALPLTLYSFRTRDGEEVDFLIEAQTRKGARFIALEAKLAVQNIGSVRIPVALRKMLPELTELWVVTPGGDETALSREARRVPIAALAQKLTAACSE
jgi:predicted AAA+ superfamily ATPase